MSDRSLEERLARIDARIEKKKAEIAELEEERSRLLHPLQVRQIVKKAKEKGMSNYDIAGRLNLDCED